MEFTIFTADDFRKRFGISLSKALPGNDDSSNKVNVALTDVKEQIEEYILSKMPYIDLTDISTAQNTFINRAAMEQLKYILDNGDLSREGGIDAYNQTLISKSELDVRVMAPRAIQILNNHIISGGFY